MSKSTTKILARTVAGAFPADKEFFIWDLEIRGFGLRVPPTGEMTFVYRYRIGRRARRMKIGPARVLKVGYARAQAQEWAVMVAQGIGRVADAFAECSIRLNQALHGLLDPSPTPDAPFASLLNVRFPSAAEHPEHQIEAHVVSL